MNQMSLLALFAVVLAPTTLSAEDDKKLAVIIDASAAPHLEDWAQQAKKLMIEWEPKISEALASPGFNSPKQITLRFKKSEKGVAHASGSTITVMSGWIEKRPDDLGVAIHEMTHVLQSYPNGQPNWITEGIADYIRFAVFAEKPVSWFPRPLKGRKDGFMMSYRVAAGFFLWLEQQSPGLVKKLNATLRSDSYTPEFFQQQTGKSLSENWNDYFENALE